MKTENEYAEALIEKYGNTLPMGVNAKGFHVQCAIIDVTNTIEALDEIWTSICDDHNINETKKYYQNVLQILKDRL